MRAWHFIKGDKLRDGTTAPKDGEWINFDGKPILCEQGLHASIDAFDALSFAPGETLCLVDCAGTVVHANDKLVCTERRIVVRMDATPLLRYFARQQALSVLHLYPGETEQCVLDFLMGDDAARAAAGAAAGAAAWAAWAAAGSAARTAAGAAAWAAWAAAGSAAWAAWAAAGSAARTAAWAAAGAAAGAAAWPTAGNDALTAARKDFNELVNDAFEDWL